MAKAKKAKTKIPKEVAGVKVPKKLRKIGKKAIKLAQQPMVSEIAAAALLGAAAALREGKAAKRGDTPEAAEAAEAADAAGAAAKEAAKEAGETVSRLGDALRMLAADLARRAVDSMAEGKGPARAPHLSRAARAKASGAAESGAGTAKAKSGKKSKGG